MSTAIKAGSAKTELQHPDWELKSLIWPQAARGLTNILCN